MSGLTATPMLPRPVLAPAPWPPARWLTPQLAGFTALCCLAGALRAADSNWLHVQFREVDTLLANPGQGWMSQQRSPRGDPRFPCSVVYIRFNWANVGVGWSGDRFASR